MSAKPRVFVTRRIPAKGLDLITAGTDAEVWPGELPPPYETLREKVQGCVGLVSLLTDRVDSALLDAAPTLKVVSKGADNMYVQTLVAGERSFAFLSKNSL